MEKPAMTKAALDKPGNPGKLNKPDQTAIEQAALAPEPNWLTPEQFLNWRRFVEGSERLNEVLSRDLESDVALTMSEYGVLVHLSESPDRTVRMSDLAKTLAHSRSRMTHTVRRLESRGLVERNSCDDDGRGVNCVMTDAGEELLVRAAPGHVNAVRRYLVDVVSPEELAQLGQIMDRIARVCGS